MFPFNITNPGIYISGLLTSQEQQFVTDLVNQSYEEGDILVHDGTQFVRLPAGADGLVLTVDSGVPVWGAPGGGGDMLVSVYDPANGAKQVAFSDELDSFVDLTTAQTIAGAKTFSSTPLTLSAASATLDFSSSVGSKVIRTGGVTNLLINPGGNVGIGVGVGNAPEKLTVGGNIALQTGSVTRLILRNDTLVDWEDNITAAQIFTTGQAGSEYPFNDNFGHLVLMGRSDTNARGDVIFARSDGSTRDISMVIKATNGNVGIGTTNIASNSRLNVIGGTWHLFGSDNTTSLTQKNFRIGFPHYDNTNNTLPVTGLYGTSNPAQHVLLVGGGTSAGYAVNTLRFFTAEGSSTATGTERMTIMPGGNVGIGTVNPAQKLHVVGDTNRVIAAGRPGTDNILTLGLDSNGTSRIAADGALRINADGNLTFFFGANEAMRLVSATGNVGIGTSTPGAKLDVVGDAHIGSEDGGRIVLATFQGNMNAFTVDNKTAGLVTMSVTAAANRFVNIRNLGTGTLGLLVEGRTGMGLTSPTAVLHLKAGTASAGTAPIKLTAGTNLTTPEAGAIEFDGTHFYGTVGSTRYQLDQQAGSGTVTSVDMSVPTGLVVTGNPVTTSGTLAVALDTGYVIPTQSELDGKAEMSPRVDSTVVYSTALTPDFDSFDGYHATEQIDPFTLNLPTNLPDGASIFIRLNAADGNQTFTPNAGYIFAEGNEAPSSFEDGYLYELIISRGPGTRYLISWSRYEV